MGLVFCNRKFYGPSAKPLFCSSLADRPEQGQRKRFRKEVDPPKLERLQLEGTVNGEWSGVQRWGKLRSGSIDYLPDLEVKKTDLARVGERYVIDEARVRKANKIVGLIAPEKELV